MQKLNIRINSALYLSQFKLATPKTIGANGLQGARFRLEELHV